ncbi:MAG: hypothetical protein SCK70_05305, partial [bacterium]|nr:hypothetical protein [bacterium]
MLRELQKLFKRKSLIEQALEESLEMLNDCSEMFRESVKSLRESDQAEISINIEEKDIKINKYE